MTEVCAVVVVGGGQAGLAAGYFLRRAGLEFVILDAQSEPGGAWRHMWPSLRLFSPAEHSPLPGWPMPRQSGVEYPGREHVVDYLTRYEQRYHLPIHRPVQVEGVHATDDHLAVHTDQGVWRGRIVISATGTWHAPYVPSYPGQHVFTGRQLHTASDRDREVVVTRSQPKQRTVDRAPRLSVSGTTLVLVDTAVWWSGRGYGGVDGGRTRLECVGQHSLSTAALSRQAPTWPIDPASPDSFRAATYWTERN